MFWKSWQRGEGVDLRYARCRGVEGKNTRPAYSILSYNTCTEPSLRLNKTTALVKIPIFCLLWPQC